MSDQTGVVMKRTMPLHRGLADSALARWCMYALMAFPIVDFALRQLPHIHPLGVVWDKIALFVLAIIALRRWIEGVRIPMLPWQKYAVWFFAFAAALMFAGLSEAVVSVQGFRVDIYYILYAFLIPFVVTPKDVPKLLHVAAMVAILIGIHGMYQYAMKVEVPSYWNVAGRTRVFSVLMSPNELGSYMALNIPLLVGMAVAERDRIRKWLYIAGIPICTFTFLFTFTRGAWASLAVAVLIMALFFERRLLIVLIVVGVVAYFLPPIHHRFGELFTQEYWLKSSTQGGRISKWLTAFDRMSSNPLFGVGVGRYGASVASQYHLSAYSDNYYAKTIGETGLIGLTLFIGMHLALLRDVFTQAVRKGRGKERFIFIGGLTGLVAVVIHNTVENVFEFAPMVITYFILAALFLVWGRGLATGEEAQADAED